MIRSASEAGPQLPVVRGAGRVPAYGRHYQLRRSRLAPPLLLAGGVVLACLALRLRDPHDPGSWALCPWLLLTGTYCPGCGGLRAVNDLTRGDLSAALSSNALLVAACPLLAAAWLRRVVSCWHGPPRPLDSRLATALAATVLTIATAFAVARNLPFAGSLAP